MKLIRHFRAAICRAVFGCACAIVAPRSGPAVDRACRLIPGSETGMAMPWAMPGMGMMTGTVGIPAGPQRLRHGVDPRCRVRADAALHGGEMGLHAARHRLRAVRRPGRPARRLAARRHQLGHAHGDARPGWWPPAAALDAEPRPRRRRRLRVSAAAADRRELPWPSAARPAASARPLHGSRGALRPRDHEGRRRRNCILRRQASRRSGRLRTCTGRPRWTIRWCRSGIIGRTRRT